MPDEGWLTTEQFGAPLAAPPMPDPGPAWPEPDGGASARTRWRRADDFGHDDLGMDLADRGRPRWDRPALAVLLIATAVAYVWDLSATGYANQFYAAAVQAATKSWKAFFFGSLDSSNFITVDKPPAALWVMDVSARIFGFNSWSLLVPNALEGVASVALVYATVRRWAGSAAGLIAGALLAATPVAALMFRYDNPDGLLVLLLVAGAYCLTRAVEKAGTGWILATGTMVGLAFLTKMLQAFTVVPAFGLVYLIAAPTTLRRRIGQLLGGLGALVVAGGWWVAIVALIPAADRPFVDGAPDNSILNLIFVYNGFGRLTGNAQPAGFSGTPGLLRLFNDSMGGQAAWLIPAAVVAAVAGVAARWRRPRTDRVRAAILLWAGWLLVTGAVFSYGKGIIHTYYTVALAPAIAALVGIGVRQLWVARRQLMARLVGAVAVGSTGALAWVLLDRSPSWYPWIRTVVAVTAAAGMILLVAAPLLRRFSNWTWGAAMALIAVGCLSGPLAYAADTVATPHNQSGGTPSAGPTSAFGGFGGFGGVGGRGAPGGRGGPGFGFGGRPGGTGFGGTGGPSGLGGAGGPSGFGNGAGATGAGFGQDGGLGELGGSGFGGGGLGGGGFGGGGFGGFGGATTSKALVRALESDAQDYRWVAATSGSNSAASLELATGGEPVMAIGGFSGQGGHLSLKAFEGYVAKGEIHYYIAGGGGGPGGGSTTAAITAWVESHFKSETIGGQTVYNLTAPTGS